MRRTGPARTRSRYQNPATLPGLRVEGMGPPLWEFSLRYGGGRQKISPHEQGRLLCTRRSEERTYLLRKAKPQRVGHLEASCCIVDARPATESALRHPLHRQFLALLGAVEKIKIDQLLVRKAGLIRQAFEIVQNLRTQVDSHGLFLADVGVLPFFQFGEVIFLLHKI